MKQGYNQAMDLAGCATLRRQVMASVGTTLPG